MILNVTMYKYLGNLQSYETKQGGVILNAENSSLKIEYFEAIGFRIRHSYTGKFEKIHSNAARDYIPTPKKIKVEQSDDEIILYGKNFQCVIQKNPIRLKFTDGDRLTFHEDSFGAANRQGKVAHIVYQPEETTYYGLGERSSKLNRTGRVFTNWNTDAAGYKKGQDPLYSSFPFYISIQNKKAYGVFYDNPYKSYFDFGARSKQHISYFAEAGELRYYVFYGPSVAEVLKCYTELTGRSPLPPKWALGYHQSRWSYYPEQDIELLANSFRQKEIPADNIHLDIDYMDGYRVFTWDKVNFPNPLKLISKLRDKGFNTIVLVDPGVKMDPGYQVYDEGLHHKYFVKWPDGSPYVGEVWPGKTCFPDFSNPAVREWWGNKYRSLLDHGIKGIWIDMNEPAVFGGDTMTDIAEFYNEGNRTDHHEMHNQYGLLMAKATFEGLKKLRPDERPFILTRAAYCGIQRYAAKWTGDNTADWDDVYLSMPMLLGLGIAGVPFSGFDIGGFEGSPNGELYLRSLQVGLFSPFMRSHTAYDTNLQEPWSFGKLIEHISRKIIELRYRLIPYLYTAFYQHYMTGAPVLRPLFWEYQNDPEVYDIDDQFLFGDHLLAAPVIEEGADSRNVYLPEGTWYNFFRGEKYQGNQIITVDAPLKTIDVFKKDYRMPLRGIPLFVRAGAVIPMQEVQQYIGQKDIDTLQLMVYAGETNSYLYEDDGKSMSYQKGYYCHYTFETISNKKYLEIKIKREGNLAGAAKKFSVNLFGFSQQPTKIECNNKPVYFEIDKDNKVIKFLIIAEDAHLIIN